MFKTVEDIEVLSDLLTLERLDANLFRAKNYLAPWGRIYGGQVFSQAMQAAYQTIGDDRFIHSAHGYFILAGNPEIPVIFEVDRIRDGKSFNTRRVVALQEGKAILNLSASFQKVKDGLNHQVEMPEVPRPDELQTDEEVAQSWKAEFPRQYGWIQERKPILFKPIENIHPADKSDRPPIKHIWTRIDGEMSVKRSMAQVMLAYVSDYNIFSAIRRPHVSKMVDKRISFASLDHAIWFYRDFDINQWFLFTWESPNAAHSRGVSFAKVYAEDGTLVASVAQEGVVYMKDK